LPGALALVLGLASSLPANAATLTVTSLANAGPGSLRQALADAAAGDEIDFAPALDGPIVLSTPLALSRSVSIRGRRNVPLDGGDATRVLSIAAGTVVTLRDVVVQRGFAVDGGGIHSAGALTLERCLVRDNHASARGGGLFIASGSYLLKDTDVADNEAINEGGGLVDFSTDGATIIDSRITGNLSNGPGGGIRHVSGRLLTIAASTIAGNQITSPATQTGGGIASQGGPINISYSTISGNKAHFAGGIYVVAPAASAPATLNLSHSIVAGNTAVSDGGGIFAFGSNINVTNSTIAHNLAGAGGGGGIGIQNTSAVAAAVSLVHTTVAFNRAQSLGGGISLISGNLALKNSLLAGNTATSNPELAGNFTSQGFNLVQNRGTSAGYVASDLANGTDPQLSAAAFNGGPTNTLRLATGSPAVNAVSAGNCAGTLLDQRGFQRPSANCDIGAFELEGTPLPVPVYADGYE
jgi:hypothetical protein